MSNYKTHNLRQFDEVMMFQTCMNLVLDHVSKFPTIYKIPQKNVIKSIKFPQLEEKPDLLTYHNVYID